MHFKSQWLWTHKGASFNMCPLSSHPRLLCIKSCFFLKRFLVTAADNVPPHKLSSLSYTPPPPTSVSKAGSLAVGPTCKFVVGLFIYLFLFFWGVQVGVWGWGGAARLLLPTPAPRVNQSTLTDVRGEAGGVSKRRGREGGRRRRCGKKEVGYGQMSGSAGGCRGRGCGKCFLSGVSSGRAQWRGVRHADKNNSPTIMLT